MAQHSSMSQFSPVRACLFDMDGLLIDSEDIYTTVTNILLRKYGKPDLPWSIKAQLQGRPGFEANRIFRDWAQLPVTPEEFREEQAALQRKLFGATKPLPGAETLLRTLSSQTHPQVYIALATSSHQINYQLKTDHMQDFFKVFLSENKVLGDDPRISAGRGKPAPDIYLVALETINARIREEGQKNEIKPSECLVFEDSVPGVESGRRAGMRVVWVPHEGLLKEYASREEEVLAGLTGEHKGEADDLNAKKGDAIPVEGQHGAKLSDVSSSDLKGWPGKAGDGWGERIMTLNDFDYAKYQIGVRST